MYTTIAKSVTSAKGIVVNPEKGKIPYTPFYHWKFSRGGELTLLGQYTHQQKPQLTNI